MAYPTDLDDFTTVENGNTISAEMFNTPNTAIEALEAKVGVNSSANDTSLDYKVNNFFVESVRKIWFMESTPPTGWTYYSSAKDQVLAVKSDSGTYSTIGANKGSWTLSGFTSLDHLHTWLLAGISSYSSNGTTQIALTDSQSQADGVLVHIYESNAHYRTNYTAYTSKATLSVSHNGTDRTYATVGIIATYTGS